MALHLTWNASAREEYWDDEWECQYWYNAQTGESTYDDPNAAGGAGGALVTVGDWVEYYDEEYDEEDYGEENKIDEQAVEIMSPGKKT